MRKGYDFGLFRAGEQPFLLRFGWPSAQLCLLENSAEKPIEYGQKIYILQD